MKHFICRGCGNLVATVEFTGRPLSCCAGELEEIGPDSVDASREKHAPVLSFEEGTVRVTVGKEGNFHPLSSEHSVRWVCLVTDKGSQRKRLSPEGRAEVTFRIDPDERVLKAFAYCNLHGLWVTAVEQ